MTHDEQRAWDLAGSIDVCMLVTHTSEGMRARPMSSIPMQAEGRIYFLTDRNARVDDNISESSRVLLAYSGSSKYLAISGEAGVSHDRQLIGRLWNNWAQAFWPNGPADPNVVALAIAPDSAEFWDGANSLVATVKMAYALATGSPPDLGDKREVPMGRH